MKVGIITFHRALNYGAVLQAYAMQTYLKSIGIDNQVIDYRCQYIERFYQPVKAKVLKQPKDFVKEILYAPFNIKKRNKFERFIRKNIKTTNPLNSHSELSVISSFFDFFITGSDQVWNDRWSGFDKAYFLDFVESDKRLSYAASFGFDKVPDGLKSEYKDLLADYRGISVRESSGCSIVQELTGNNAVVNADPTLLLTQEEWKNIADNPKEKDYVLVYTLEKSEKLEKLATELADTRNVKVIRIVDAIRKMKEYDSRGFLSPAEFVGLFNNAGCVITNSFHGLMFSCIFEKEFYLGYQERQGAPNSRLVDFVNEYGLQFRVVNGGAYNPQLPVDYLHVANVTAKKRKDTHEYFKHYLTNQMNIPQLPISKSKCCGCRACEQICPKNAISMVEDGEGFLYPEIDVSRCINCGLCVRTCSFSKRNSDGSIEPIDTFLAKHYDPEKRKRSRSGGAFLALSDEIFRRGGVVYGVKLDDNFCAVHARATNSKERDAFCGSKYVQSDTNSVFKSVYKDLKQGLPVLFSGTGCQIDSLYGYLNARRLNEDLVRLYTCDIVCHGVVSPKLWMDNVSDIKRNHGEELIRIDFRNKKYGWNSHIETYEFADKIVESEYYTSVFYEHVAFRHSCYQCPYASINRVSDITLADAWHIKRNAPDWDDNLGVSFLLVNSRKGYELLKRVKDLELRRIEMEKMMQPNLSHPTPYPNWRAQFWEEYNKKGFSYVANRCHALQMKIKKKNLIKAKIVAVLRAISI